MKITLNQCLQVWNVLSELRAINESIPPKISGNMAYLRSEVQKLSELSAEERKALADAEIDVPLQAITKDDLPAVMPPDFHEALNPIAKEEMTNEKTGVEKLMESQKNGESKQKAKTNK